MDEREVDGWARGFSKLIIYIDKIIAYIGLKNYTLVTEDLLYSLYVASHTNLLFLWNEENLW